MENRQRPDRRKDISQRDIKTFPTGTKQRQNRRKIERLQRSGSSKGCLLSGQCKTVCVEANKPTAASISLSKRFRKSFPNELSENDCFSCASFSVGKAKRFHMKTKGDKMNNNLEKNIPKQPVTSRSIKCDFSFSRRTPHLPLGKRPVIKIGKIY